MHPHPAPVYPHPLLALCPNPIGCHRVSSRTSLSSLSPSLPSSYSSRRLVLLVGVPATSSREPPEHQTKQQRHHAKHQQRHGAHGPRRSSSEVNLLREHRLRRPVAPHHRSPPSLSLISPGACHPSPPCRRTSPLSGMGRSPPDPALAPIYDPDLVDSRRRAAVPNTGALLFPVVSILILI
ncbi:uncharacterized protein LOC123397726 [Hordeum vulgare subsp. vulgare]|uniref:uncharacterized protein LOC123397726 n=1 Tax=Hordeum vulgare subsp. vulgare TaxID=112509 RepID=UPI001D1A3F91|nr:uncharacterized protein LOC123397726 [Hordeum vulgare subsp. vulgare]